MNMDTYTFKARWLPALIAFAPLSLAAISWLGGDQEAWEEWGAVILTTGLGALLVNLARERGKKLEPLLFSSWGGKSTNRMLRHTSEYPEQAARWRTLLHAMIDIELPDEDEEVEDIDTADRKYDVAVKKLINMRRDRKKYPLIFSENCNYGFWRNLIGLKPLGIMLTMVAILFSILPVGLHIIEKGNSLNPSTLSTLAIPVFALIVNTLMMIFWLFFARRHCVKHAADAYASRLLESLES